MEERLRLPLPSEGSPPAGLKGSAEQRHRHLLVDWDTDACAYL